MNFSIQLNNSDRTRTVITNAMTKHGIEGDPDDYCLVQLIPGGGMYVIFFQTFISYVNLILFCWDPSIIYHKSFLTKTLFFF